MNMICTHTSKLDLEIVKTRELQPGMPKNIPRGLLLSPLLRNKICCLSLPIFLRASSYLGCLIKPIQKRLLLLLLQFKPKNRILISQIEQIVVKM